MGGGGRKKKGKKDSRGDRIRKKRASGLRPYWSKSTNKSADIPDVILNSAIKGPMNSDRDREEGPLEKSVLDHLKKLKERHLKNYKVKTSELMWNLMSTYLSPKVEDIQRHIVNHVEYTIARSRFDFDNLSSYLATSYSVRDRLIELWNDTQTQYHNTKSKIAYYISMEYLTGRFLSNAVLNLNLEKNYKEALLGLGYSLETLYEEEHDPGLGNGGLGRLAACFLDSLATHNYPSWGYGLRYSYGIFKQEIDKDGSQIEKPDYWLRNGVPWMVEKPFIQVPVRFYGEVVSDTDYFGKERRRWVNGMTVIAQACDIFIPGYGTDNTNTLRLWASKPSQEIDFDEFNRGDYFSSIRKKQIAENITSVLYPNDNTMNGKELRLQQEYFLCAATLADIIRRVKQSLHMSVRDLPKLAAIQLNDTHPALVIAELMRILIDEEELDWDEAWDITTRTTSYTNHTVLPEALETWDVPMFQRLLPRHMEIIYFINLVFLNSVKVNFPGDNELLSKVSIIEEGYPKKVRMANLAIIGSHAVNGVAKLHTNIIKEEVFKEFYRIWPEKFVNITNGVTPRRWMHQANPMLSDLITEKLGHSMWIVDLELLSGLEKYVDDEDFRRKWAAVKLLNKERLQMYIQKTLGISIDTNDVMYDIQIKRIHEYKRQLMNVFHVIHRYIKLKAMSEEKRRGMVRRVVFFAGKAAPGYYNAKLIIKLVSKVSGVINNDPETGDLLKVIFIPNYSVSMAEILIPASDISEHISTAGTEASGTSNMKFCLNGGIIIGTEDGANVEIHERVGDDNILIFGSQRDEVAKLRESNKKLGKEKVGRDLRNVLEYILGGAFGPGEEFRPLIDSVYRDDYYLISNDFPSYLEAQRRADKLFKDRDTWRRMSIINTARNGYFSSDRSIKEYCEKIWDVRPDPLKAVEIEEVEYLDGDKTAAKIRISKAKKASDAIPVARPPGSDAPRESLSVGSSYGGRRVYQESGSVDVSGRVSDELESEDSLLWQGNDSSLDEFV